MRRGDASRRALEGKPSQMVDHSPFWMRWIKVGSRNAQSEHEGNALSGDELDVYGAFRLLPTLLESSSLPDGVIEFVIDDVQATRQVFDVRDGRVTLVRPGAAVPWASISGPPTAWASALGPKGEVTALALTGDQRLAQRVLTALGPAFRTRSG